MKTLLVGLSLITLTGCLSSGAPDPNVALRAANDTACVLGLASLGVSVSNGMAAPAIIATITAATAGNPGLASACAGLIGNIQQDVTGGVAKIQGIQSTVPAAAPVVK